MRGTQFGFDSGAPTEHEDLGRPDLDGRHTEQWFRAGCLTPDTPDPRRTPISPDWGSKSADMARIAFQQPFQMAFRAREWLS